MATGTLVGPSEFSVSTSPTSGKLKKIATPSEIQTNVKTFTLPTLARSGSVPLISDMIRVVRRITTAVISVVGSRKVLRKLNLEFEMKQAI